MADQISILHLTETDENLHKQKLNFKQDSEAITLNVGSDSLSYAVKVTFETQDADQFEEMVEGDQLSTPKKSGAAKASMVEQTTGEDSASKMEICPDKEDSVSKASVELLLDEIVAETDKFDPLEQAFLAGFYHESPKKVAYEMEDLESIESPKEFSHETAEQELRAQIGARPLSELHGQMVNIGGQSLIVKVVTVSASVSPDTPIDPAQASKVEQTTQRGEKTPTKEMNQDQGALNQNLLDAAQDVLFNADDDDVLDTPAKAEDFLSRRTRTRHQTTNYDNLKSRANWGQQHMLTYVNTHGLDRNNSIPAKVVESGMKEYALDTRAMKRKQRKLNSHNRGNFVKINEVKLTPEEVKAEESYGHWTLPLEDTSDD